jgi:CheY-like chemotaxis protein
MHIPIVEDNGDVRESLAAVLEVDGYRVSCASNGQDALDQLRSQPSWSRLSRRG